MGDALTYKIRMVRIRPRALKGSFQQIDPKVDAFLDQYNEPFGIATTNAAGENTFSQFEFHMAKVNTRRYQVLQDDTYTMGSSGNRTDLTSTSIQVPYSTEQGGFKKIKTLHKIGTELFWENPNGDSDKDQYPDAGFVNEFVMFHVMAVGNPNASAVDRSTADLLRISARPLSTFKDQ